MVWDPWVMNGPWHPGTLPGISIVTGWEPTVTNSGNDEPPAKPIYVDPKLSTKKDGNNNNNTTTTTTKV